MKISLNWIKDYAHIPSGISPEKLGELFTLKTAEVEEVTREDQLLDNVVVGQIMSLAKHPNADKLQVCETSIGEKKIQIVCGGTNLKENMYVAVALVGAKVKWHGENELVEMKKVKIRGVESEGMICAETELGLGERSEEIMDLSPMKPKVGTPLADLFQKTDTILTIDNKSLTHRPDLWGHYGIALEFSAILGTEFKSLHPDVNIPKKGESVKVEVKNTELCPRYCGIIINGIKIEESPDWLKYRLKSIGIKTINNIVDITNFVLAELGQPLHAFDKAFIKNGIIVRNAKEGEKIITLDKEERKLTSEMLVIADSEKPIAIAGVMGGQNSEILPSTTSIIIEAANFNAANIRRTSQSLGLRTESAQRFEKSLDPNLPEYAICRACELILRLCPKAEIIGPLTDIAHFNKKEPIIKLDINRVHSKIGIKITRAKIKKHLESLKFSVDENFNVKIPTWRANKDIETEDDLIEEIARLHGYNEIPPELPRLPIRLPEENHERVLKHKARTILSFGLGFNEVSNYSFYSLNDLIRAGLDGKDHFLLENYLSEDQTHMRISLIPNLLKTIARNLRFQSHFNIYEIGRTYKKIGNYFPLEEKKITGAIVGEGEVFYEAKGALEAFFEKFNAPRLKSKKTTPSPCAHPAKCLGYGEVASCFELHPAIAKAFGLEKVKIAIFEINFTRLTALGHPDKKYRQIPRFPGIGIDISVVIDRKTEVEKVENTIRESDTHLIKDVKLFDIYESAAIEKDKKSLAFKVTLQANDRTLTDEEMTKTQNKIFQNLQALGGKIRGL